MKLTSFIAYAAIGAIALVGIDLYRSRAGEASATPVAATTPRAPQPQPAPAPVEDRSWIKPRDSAPAAASPAPADTRCDGRTHCSQMRSCEEATYFLQHCPGTQMDGDNDGVPCEQQWC
jgi:hypothetical protein